MGQSTEELTTGIESSRENLSRDFDELNDKVNPQRVIARRKEATRNRLGSLREKVMGTAAGTRDRAGSTAGGAVSSATGSASGAAHVAQGAVGTVERRTEGNPLAAGVVAFGAGMLISALIPASETEARSAQRAVRAAKEHGQPVLDEAKSAGQEIGSDLKDSAAERAEDLKSSAQDSVESVKEEGRSSAQQVKDDTQRRL